MNSLNRSIALAITLMAFVSNSVFAQGLNPHQADVHFGSSDVDGASLGGKLVRKKMKNEYEYIQLLCTDPAAKDPKTCDHFQFGHILKNKSNSDSAAVFFSQSVYKQSDLQSVHDFKNALRKVHFKSDLGTALEHAEIQTGMGCFGAGMLLGILIGSGGKVGSSDASTAGIIAGGIIALAPSIAVGLVCSAYDLVALAPEAAIVSIKTRKYLQSIVEDNADTTVKMRSHYNDFQDILMK